jgi:hypothetical protein
MPIPGVLLLLAGAYAAGGVRTSCRRADGRVDCHIRTLRIFELCEVGSQDAHDVVDAYDVTTTSGTGAPSRSSREHSTSNDTIVLETRDGAKVYAFGDTSKGSGDHVSELRHFLGDPKLTSLHLFSSDWPFGVVAMAFGAAWTVLTGIVAVISRNES